MILFKDPGPALTGERPFAKVFITRVWRHRLGERTEGEAQAEGYPSEVDFLERFTAGRRFKAPVAQVEVYALEFRLVEAYEAPPSGR